MEDEKKNEFKTRICGALNLSSDVSNAALEERKLDARYPLEGLVGVEIVASRVGLSPTMEPGVDNIAKSVLDAMTGIIYADDSQVVHLSVCKKLSETSYTMIRVWPLDGEL